MITRRMFNAAIAALPFGSLPEPEPNKQLIFDPYPGIYAGDVLRIRGWYLIHCYPHVEWLLKPPFTAPHRDHLSWGQYTVRRREDYRLIVCRNNREIAIEIDEFRAFLNGGHLVNLTRSSKA